jgi:hypothetical protein
MKIKAGLVAVAAATVFAMAANGAWAQDAAASGSPVTDKAQKGRGGGANPEIKSNEMKNSASSEAPPQPEEKGGVKARAPLCRLHVDNRTRWYVEVYVDGLRRGSVGPYGDVYGTFVGGTTRLYAEAPFDDGSSYYWGPKVINCNGGYDWRLTD